MSPSESIHILYIRNEVTTTRFFQHKLEEAGYNVDIAADNSHGLEMCRRKVYDVVIVDQVVSTQDGLEIIRMLSTTLEKPTSTIVVASAGEEKAAAEAMRLGASDYIIKDEEGGYLELLTSVIEQVLMQRRLADEKTQAEKELERNLVQIERAKQEWETTVDSLNQFVCLLDYHGRIIRANRTVERWELTNVLDVRGRTLPDLLNLQIDWADVRDRLMEGEAIAFETNDSNINRYLFIQIRPISSKTTRRQLTLTSFAAVVIQDISRRKEAEQALRTHAQELQIRNEELDAFAHTVAHDLQSPLGLMIGFAGALNKHHDIMSMDEIMLYLEKIVETGTKMSKIIQELLMLASLRQEEVELQPVDMRDLVNESQVRLSAMIEERQAEIIMPDEWPIALGYAPWVEEVWVNYISNGLKYGGDPPRLELGAVADEDDMIRFWISDNGPGLTEEEQDQLFKPFRRLGKERVKGHGLGLSIVQRIVEKLGGRAFVESEGIEGKGSVFSFTLPMDSNYVDNNNGSGINN